jgi:predicted RNA-binding Zn-ribbon protein involved in translation (DUF1610 family)
MKIKMKVKTPKIDFKKEAMRIKHKMKCPACNKDIVITFKELSRDKFTCPKCKNIISIKHK